MNRYLLKIAEFYSPNLSKENKQVAHTFLTSWGASIPADLAGAYVGSRIGQKYRGFTIPLSKSHVSGETLGGALGALAASGVVELAAIKHSLHGKINE